jgi:NADPH-dependent glutamate synthase beta subunit-like oxidoreductase
VTDPMERSKERVPIPEEPARERVDGFGEILHAYSRDDAMLEAQRCLQCALPYCVEACPITQDCRGYIGLVAAGQFDDAAKLTLQDNPLASTLCVTCYHFCEDACVLNDHGTPIAIRQLKRASLDFGTSNLQYVPGAPRTQRVAVVGAGPAGLMAAWELCLRGYPVTIFEKEKYLGGQAATIPRYHLRDELTVDVQRFQRFDCTFVMGKEVGQDFTPESLLAEGYRAVYLALGASEANDPGLPGENLPGSYPALDFLRDVNTGADVRVGSRIVVVGGGDVAVDAVRSALRLSHGGQATLVYRRGPGQMSAGEQELQEANPEGVQFTYFRSPLRVQGTDRVEGLVVQRTQPGPPDEHGRATVVNVPDAIETMPCDTVILAVGEKGDLRGFPRELRLRLSPKGWPEGDQADTMTEVPGVFASGGRSVVHAMAAGTRSAEAIDAFLRKAEGNAPSVRPDPFGGPSPHGLPKGYTGPTWRP